MRKKVTLPLPGGCSLCNQSPDIHRLKVVERNREFVIQCGHNLFRVDPDTRVVVAECLECHCEADRMDLDQGDDAGSWQTLVERAIATQCVVYLEYYDEDHALTCRVVEPHDVFESRESHTLLLAWCLHREAVRAFRLDRIRAMVLTRRGFTPRQLGVKEGSEYVSV